jgi:hypothetical protein
MQELEDAVRRYLAWEWIVSQRESLNLTVQQAKQAEEQKKSADAAVNARVPEAYQWVLVPVQNNATDPVEWQAIRLTGQAPLAERASKKLRNDELLVTKLAASVLRNWMDKIPLWRDDRHVSVRQLVEDFGRYVYLPRLKSPAVLLEAIQDGLGLLSWELDSFAYAEGRDEDAGRYRGLRVGQQVGVLEADSPALLVQPSIARAQLEAEKPEPPAQPGEPVGTDGGGPVPGPGPSGPNGPKTAPRPTRYHGTVMLEPTRTGRDASRIADELIAHLVGLVGSTVRVTMEIEAEIPGGAPESVVRTVTENGRTLKFTNQGFESE